MMTLADWKEKEKEQRRNYILEAAEKLFFSSGFDNVTMDDIAKEVGLNKKTIYLYFKNKESLFFAVVLRGTKILNAIVMDKIKYHENGFDRLWEVGHAYYSFAAKYPDYNRICNYFYSGRFELEKIIKNDELIFLYGSAVDFWKLVDWASITNGDVVKEIVELRKEIFDVIRDSIQNGMEEGTFRHDINPEEAAAVFTLLLESRPNMRPDLKMMLESHGIDQRKFARDIGDFVRHMLANKDMAGKGRA